MSCKSLHEFLSLSNVHAGVFEKAPTLRVYTRWMRLSTAGANTLLSFPPFNPQNHFSSTQICRAERELFECAFPLESGDASSALWSLMEPLGSILHDTIRPQYIQLNDIYTLAELVDVLSGEVSTVQK